MLSRSRYNRPLDPVKLRGVEVVLDKSGALYVPSQRLLVVSDLHFEKGSSYARGGQFLPPYDTRATLRSLADVVGRRRPSTIISLGDTFHDLGAEGRMDPADIEVLKALCEASQWIFVLGNHDPAPPAMFKGEAMVTAIRAGLTFTHEPEETDDWNVAGHLHPCAAVAGSGRRVRRRCFIYDKERLVMPAFGAYTGGLNVLDNAFAPLFDRSVNVSICGDERPYRVPIAALLPDGGGLYSGRGTTQLGQRGARRR